MRGCRECGVKVLAGDYLCNYHRHVRPELTGESPIDLSGGPLYATAQELLGALRGVVPIVEKWMRECDEKYGEGWLGLDGTPSAMDEARVAIAKATGEQVPA
jgi:hypothetical protein